MLVKAELWVPDFNAFDLPTPHLSVYRGVVVCWGPDRDGSVLTFIDGLETPARENLIAAHLGDAGLWLLWSRWAPVHLRKGDVAPVGGRAVAVDVSRVLEPAFRVLAPAPTQRE